MRSLRTKIISGAFAVAVVALAVSAVLSAGADATVALKNVTVFEGNLTRWVNADGAAAVASQLAQADVLVVTFAATHTYGESDWPNLPYNAEGCQSLSGADNQSNDRAALISVLSQVKSIKPSLLVFGYVAGTADAPDQVVNGVNRAALCGNNVDNYNNVDGALGNGTTTFTACPQSSCLNFVRWVQDWITTSDSLHSYINGIFIDYVSSQKMPKSARDNEYAYVHSLGLPVMVNSTLPGAPWDPTPGTPQYNVNGDPGNVDNYQWAADSPYLTSSDYIMVEGYWVAGFNGNGGVATGEYDATDRIGAIRSSLATKYGAANEPRIAALATEPTDSQLSSLSCSFSDFTGAKSEALASAVDGDAIGYQFSDYGSLPTSGAPVKPIGPYCK